MSFGQMIRYGVPITSIDQLEQVYRFDESAYSNGGYGAESISWELFTSWWKAFPTGFLGAFDDGRPVAVIGLFPVTSIWATYFLTYHVSEATLDAATIKCGIDEAACSTRVHWYFSGLSAQTAAPRARVSLPCLLGLSIFEWLMLNETINNGKEIVLVAEASTSIGDKLLRKYLAAEAAEVISQGSHRRYRMTTDAEDIQSTLCQVPLFKRCSELQQRLMPVYKNLR